MLLKISNNYHLASLNNITISKTKAINNKRIPMPKEDKTIPIIFKIPEAFASLTSFLSKIKPIENKIPKTNKTK